MKLLSLRLLMLLSLLSPQLCSPRRTMAEEQSTTRSVGNDPQSLDEFRDLAFGLFIHWSLDVQYGAVISHSLVGSDAEYRERYFRDLPKSFNPVDYDPNRWAELAQVCGFKYAVLTSKHHSGFCLFPTETTDFNITNTRYGKDIVGPYMNAFRNEGLKVGLYFSPEDFWVLHQQGRVPARAKERGYTQTSDNPGLKQHDLAQMRELLTAYRPVDIWFFDSKESSKELKELVWEDNPKSIVTRGEIATPEQNLRGADTSVPWEACFTLGNQWQYRGTNEKYKSAREVIQLLIETRAQGGNLLLNVGPDAYGRIPHEQEWILREIGLWLFINQDAIYKVRPWHVEREGDVWMTQAKDGGAIYLFLTNQDGWKLGERREFTVKSVELTEKSAVSVLGHGGEVLEYNPAADPSVQFHSDDKGLHLSVMRAQRIYNDTKWPNPVVVRVTHPKQALPRASE
jgi:alpha-L-fucosidase